MKKHLLFITLATLSFSALAATTATLELRGQVPANLSIEVTPEAVAANLQLDVTQTNTKVAVVTEKSNSSSGYKVSISSANLGVLKNTVTADPFNYVLSYDGVALDLSSEAHPTPYTNGGNVEFNKDITISYTGVPFADLDEGTYADDVTFTIAAN